MQPSIINFYKPTNLSLFDENPERYSVATTPEVNDYLEANQIVAIGISGGKDSSCLAIRVNEYLDEIGHTGTRVLVHADLGSVEWKESLPVCEKLAERLGLELIVVKRKAGGLMQRWQSRWESNLNRYVNLECVKLIMPWSTPKNRFCTSEMKTQVICAELTRRYPGQRILSLTGVRRDESAKRSKMPIASVQEKLSSRKCEGLNWNPIINWPTNHVFEYLALKHEPLHEAYTKYGNSRVSCTFCIMSSIGDLMASASCEDNAAIYRTMVQLEIDSTFAFQETRWLGDVAPHLLTEKMRDQLQVAKQKAEYRIAAEARLPKHLMFKDGWPENIPSFEDAELIADVRQNVALAMGLSIKYTSAGAIQDRYAELMEIQKIKLESKKKKSDRA